MVILSKEEYLARLQAIVGEDTSEETIQLIEDFTDTYNDFETKTSDNTNWQTKYQENDEMWRKKYKERFFSSAQEVKEEQVEDVIEDSESDKLSYNDLFEEREG